MFSLKRFVVGVWVNIFYSLFYVSKSTNISFRSPPYAVVLRFRNFVDEYTAKPFVNLRNR